MKGGNQHRLKRISPETPFSVAQLAILEQRRAELLSGQNKGTDWQTMHNRIRVDFKEKQRLNDKK